MVFKPFALSARDVGTRSTHSSSEVRPRQESSLISCLDETAGRSGKHDLAIKLTWAGGKLIHAQFIMVIWALCGGHMTVAQLAKEVEFL